MKAMLIKLLIIKLVIVCFADVLFASKMERPITAWPILYHKKDADSVKTDVLWPIFDYDRIKSENKFHMRPWIFYLISNKETDYHKTQLFWFLFYYERLSNKSLNLYLPPFYWHTKENDEINTVFFPLYWSKDSKDMFYRHYWPLYGKSREPNWTEYSVIYPFFKYGTSDDRSNNRYDFLWPLGRFQSAQELSQQRLLPFFYFKEDKNDKSYINNILLLAWGRWGDQDIKSSYFLFPLYWRYIDLQEKTDSTSLIFPLFNYTKGSDYKSSWLFPLYYSKYDTNYNYKNAIILAYLSQYKGTPEDHSFYIFPLVWTAKNDKRTYTHVWPFYGYEEKGSFKAWSTIYPFFRYGVDKENGKYSFNTLWPLILSRGSKESSYTHVLPLAYFYKNPKLNLDLILPLYFRHQDEDSSLKFITPLYIEKKGMHDNFQMLLPVYYHFADTNSYSRFILPFWYELKREKSNFFSFIPFYYNFQDRENKLSFKYYFPFYGQYLRGDSYVRHLFLFPLYSHVNDSLAGIKAWDAVWPLFHHDKTPTTESTRILPLYIHSTAPEYDLKTIMPLYWSYNTTDKSNTFLVPFYAKMRNKNKFTSLLFPFYYNQKDDNKKFTFCSLSFLPPYYVNKISTNTKLNHFWPFYGHSRFDTYIEKSVLWPLFRIAHDTKTQQSMTHLLLYYNSIYPDKYATYFFPFYRAKGDKENGFSWLFPFYYKKREGYVEKTLGSLVLLPPYCISKKTNKSYMFHLWPLFGYEKIGAYKEYSTLWPFIRYAAQPEIDMNRFQFFNIYHKRYGEEYLTAFIPLFCAKKKEDAGSSWLFPFYYYYKDTNKLYTLASLSLLPPYYIREKDTDKNLFHLWPFYEYLTEGTYKENAVLWPLFRYGRDKEQRFSMHQFILWYYNRKKDDIFYTFFPVVWGKRNLYQYEMKTPFIYKLARDYDERDYRFVWIPFTDLKLIGYNNNEEMYRHFFFPVYSYKNEKKEQKKVFSILWRLVRKVSSPELSTFEFNPFYYTEKNGHGNYWAIFGGLLGVETTSEGKRNYRLLWFLDI